MMPRLLPAMSEGMFSRLGLQFERCIWAAKEDPG
jgi:hypothetical protein